MVGSTTWIPGISDCIQMHSTAIGLLSYRVPVYLQVRKFDYYCFLLPHTRRQHESFQRLNFWLTSFIAQWQNNWNIKQHCVMSLLVLILMCLHTQYNIKKNNVLLDCRVVSHIYYNEYTLDAQLITLMLIWKQTTVLLEVGGL